MNNIFSDIFNKIDWASFAIGSYAAVLSTYQTLKERNNIKIIYLNKNHLTYYSEFSSYDMYENLIFPNTSSYNFYFKVRIINRSKNPTSIYGFLLNNKYKYNSDNAVFETKVPTSYKISNNRLVSNEFTFIDLNLKPIFKLEPFSTVEGYLCFKNISKISSIFSLTIQSSQKNKTFLFKCKIDDSINNIEE